MAFTGNNGQMPQKGTLAYYEKQSVSARGSLIGVLVFTLINILIGIFSEEPTVFLFSSWLPLDVACAVKDIYVSYEAFITAGVVVAGGFMVALLLCAIFWKKGVAAPAAACALYLLDCAYVVLGLMETGPGYYVPTAGIAIFHAIVMVLLVIGLVNEAKARKLRKEAEAAVPFAAQEQAAGQQGPEL